MEVASLPKMMKPVTGGEAMSKHSPDLPGWLGTARRIDQSRNLGDPAGWGKGNRPPDHRPGQEAGQSAQFDASHRTSHCGGYSLHHIVRQLKIRRPFYCICGNAQCLPGIGNTVLNLYQCNNQGMITRIGWSIQLGSVKENSPPMNADEHG